MDSDSDSDQTGVDSDSDRMSGAPFTSSRVQAGLLCATK